MSIPKLKKIRVLDEKELLIFSGGTIPCRSCDHSCKKSCTSNKNGNNGNGNTISVPIKK